MRIAYMSMFKQLLSFSTFTMSTQSSRSLLIGLHQQLCLGWYFNAISMLSDYHKANYCFKGNTDRGWSITLVHFNLGSMLREYDLQTPAFKLKPGRSTLNYRVVCMSQVEKEIVMFSSTLEPFWRPLCSFTQVYTHIYTLASSIFSSCVQQTQ